MDDQNIKITKFLVEPGNFEIMVSVVDRFDDIKRSLLSEFWKLTKENIIQVSKERNLSWQAEIEDNIFKQWSKLHLYKPEWRHVKSENLIISCAYQSLSSNLMFGIFTNFGKFKDIYKYEIIRKHFKSIPEFSDFGSDKWWPVYKYLDYDFSENKDLKYLLHDVRDKTSLTFAQLIVEFAIKVEPDLNKLYKELIK